MHYASSRRNKIESMSKPIGGLKPKPKVVREQSRKFHRQPREPKELKAEESELKEPSDKPREQQAKI
eukprot:11932859-Ditylum_brightwellii.AAC.1